VVELALFKAYFGWHLLSEADNPILQSLLDLGKRMMSNVLSRVQAGGFARSQAAKSRANQWATGRSR
jgi:hypothetical protein